MRGDAPPQQRRPERRRLEPQAQVVAYLAGSTPFREFYDCVLGDEALQAYLEQDVSLPPFVGRNNALLYLFDQDLADAGSDLNVREVLSAFLTGLNVEHRVDRASSLDYDLVLRAAPAWLILPGTYIADLLASLPADQNRVARTRLAKARIARDFRYVRRPPKWLQSAVWPSADGKPLLFVGQLDLGTTLRDDAQVFVFMDERTREVRTILQTA